VAEIVEEIHERSIAGHRGVSDEEFAGIAKNVLKPAAG